MKINDKNALDVLKKEFSRFLWNPQSNLCNDGKANVDDKKIIDLLIKYWDLKPSDAKRILRI